MNYKYVYIQPSKLRALKHDDLGFSDTLCHAKKGEEVAGHKYTSREWKNGAWQYIYGKIGGNQLKEYEKTFDRQLMSKKSLENTYNDIEKTNDAIKNIKTDKYLLENFMDSFKTHPDLKGTSGGQLDSLAKKYNYYGGTKDPNSSKGLKIYTYDELKELNKQIEMQESKLKASRERLIKTYDEKADIHTNQIIKYNRAENNYKKTLLSRIKGDIMKNYTKYQ